MKIYAENKKARFNYDISDTYEAGIVLIGAEVKSIRAGQISLKESFGTLKAGELWLTNAHIATYKPAKLQDYNPTKSRKLLLNKAEVSKIAGKIQDAKIVLVPLKVYDKKGKIKVELGLGKGKKKYSKRESLKREDIKRDAERDLKERRKKTD